MNLLFNMICRIGIFMICAQVILFFRPDKTYEKYMKLLAEIMVVVQIFTWTAGYFKKSAGENLGVRMEWFSEKLTEGIENGKGMDFTGADRILEEVEQIQENLVEEWREQTETDFSAETEQIEGINGVDEIEEVEKIEIHVGRKSGQEGGKSV